MTARIDFPNLSYPSSKVMVDGQLLEGRINRNFVTIDDIGPGKHRFERYFH